MRLDEARGLVGEAVFWEKDGEVLQVRIFGVTKNMVSIQGTGWNTTGDTAEPRLVDLGELSPVPYRDLLPSTQAELNEFAFGVLVDTHWDFGQTDAALEALRNMNWAAGNTFDGQPPPAGHAEDFAKEAVLAAWRLWQAADPSNAMARAQAGSPVQQPEITGPALVYLVAHSGMGAVKVGVSDASGSRIARHRQRGWQLVAAFQVSTGKAAVSIERDILQWWRTELGLASRVKQHDMPQGGWTETADLVRVDLAATVARICELALVPAARPRPPQGY